MNRDQQGPFEGQVDSPKPATVKVRSRLQSTVWGILLSGGLSLVALIAWLAAYQRDDMPELTDRTLESANELWLANGPPDYDLEIVISGNRPGRVHVEIRGGAATAMTRDGTTPKQPRVWQYWTVPGQFEMLREELDHAKNPRDAFGTGANQLVLRAEFDQRFGYPRRFQRTVYGQDQTLRWEITEFLPK